MNENRASVPAPENPSPESHPPFNELSVLFPLLSIYTAAYLALMAADFLLRQALDVPPGLMPLYIALLGAYVADKEIRRWTGRADRPRKGSVFVYLWVLLFLGCFLVHTFRPDFSLPDEIGKVALQVLGVFLGTRASKALHGRLRADTGGSAAETERQTKVLALVGERGKITRAEVSDQLGISEATAKRLLQALVDQGRLEKRGEGHAVYYAMPANTPKSV